MEIVNHRLVVDGNAVPFKLTPNRSGIINPEIIILHDTAGHLDTSGSVNWLTNPAARASAHLVVGRDGSVVQLAPFNVATWHAGASEYNKRGNVNRFSVGIEIVNPGYMTAGKSGYAKAWFKTEYAMAEWGIEHSSSPDHGPGLWMPYAPEQLKALKAICAALIKTYGLRDISTHYAIAPRRKVDVNPLFPIKDFRKELLGDDVGPMGGASNRPGAEIKQPKPTPALLRRGSTGALVRQLQDALTAAGIPTISDGDFGPKTESSVKKFQTIKGLSVDGIAGPITLVVLAIANDSAI